MTCETCTCDLKSLFAGLLARWDPGRGPARVTEHLFNCSFEDFQNVEYFAKQLEMERVKRLIEAEEWKQRLVVADNQGNELLTASWDVLVVTKSLEMAKFPIKIFSRSPSTSSPLEGQGWCAFYLGPGSPSIKGRAEISIDQLSYQLPCGLAVDTTVLHLRSYVSRVVAVPLSDVTVARDGRTLSDTETPGGLRERAAPMLEEAHTKAMREAQAAGLTNEDAQLKAQQARDAKWRDLQVRWKDRTAEFLVQISR